ncbi:MAG: energy transducer TonB [Bacteroidia bacterium]|nr:energy transducer TonB [Bacteroidia bacterium]
MDDYGYTGSPTEEQARRLESLEQRQRRYKWALLIFAGLTMLLLGLLWFIMMSGGAKKVTYMVLNPENSAKAKQDKSTIMEDTLVVFGPEVEFSNSGDTINSLNEGQEDFNTPESRIISALEEDQRYSPSTSEDKKATYDYSHNSYEEKSSAKSVYDYPMDLIIKGDPTTGKKLLFIIEGYEVGMNYSLKFQENHTQSNVGETTLFAYRQVGTYRIQLMVEDENGDRRSIVKNIEILPPMHSLSLEEKLLASTKNVKGSQAKMIKTSTLPNLKKSATPELADTKNLVKPDFSTPKKAEPKTKEEKVDTTPLKLARQMPSFPGGDAILKKYLDLNLRYPEKALASKVEGRIYVRFVVQPDGQLTDVRIMRGLGHGCDEEVIRLVNQMPKWTPGKQGGKTVPVYYTLPINFRIN